MNFVTMDLMLNKVLIDKKNAPIMLPKIEEMYMFENPSAFEQESPEQYEKDFSMFHMTSSMNKNSHQIAKQIGMNLSKKAVFNIIERISKTINLLSQKESISWQKDKNHSQLMKALYDSFLVSMPESEDYRDFFV